MPNPDSWRSAAPAYPWQQVYKAAVLERDPAKMEQFIQSAFTSIYEHLRARGDITAKESEALTDALHAGLAVVAAYTDMKGRHRERSPADRSTRNGGPRLSGKKFQAGRHSDQPSDLENLTRPPKAGALTS